MAQARARAPKQERRMVELGPYGALNYALVVARNPDMTTTATPKHIWYRVEMDRDRLDAMARRAAKSKTGRCVDGALVVTVVEG